MYMDKMKVRAKSDGTQKHISSMQLSFVDIQLFVDTSHDDKLDLLILLKAIHTALSSNTREFHTNDDG